VLPVYVLCGGLAGEDGYEAAIMALRREEKKVL
jgi:hypothetical protein